MRALVSDYGLNRPLRTEAPGPRSAPIALLLIFSILGAAGVCLAVVYLITS